MGYSRPRVTWLPPFRNLLHRVAQTSFCCLTCDYHVTWTPLSATYLHFALFSSNLCPSRFHASRAQWLRLSLCWDVIWCKLVFIYRRFGTTYRPHLNCRSVGNEIPTYSALTSQKNENIDLDSNVSLRILFPDTNLQQNKGKLFIQN
jgi:hypothetical protein